MKKVLSHNFWLCKEYNFLGTFYSLNEIMKKMHKNCNCHVGSLQSKQYRKKTNKNFVFILLNWTYFINKMFLNLIKIMPTMFVQHSNVTSLTISGFLGADKNGLGWLFV